MPIPFFKIALGLLTGASVAYVLARRPTWGIPPVAPWASPAPSAPEAKAAPLSNAPAPTAPAAPQAAPAAPMTNAPAPTAPAAAQAPAAAPLTDAPTPPTSSVPQAPAAAPMTGAPAPAAPQAPAAAPAAPAAWVNISVPSRVPTVHREDGCRFVQRKRESPAKGVGRLKGQGGWLPFPSRDAAQAAYPNATVCTVRGCWDEDASTWQNSVTSPEPASATS